MGVRGPARPMRQALATRLPLRSRSLLAARRHFQTGEIITFLRGPHTGLLRCLRGVYYKWFFGFRKIKSAKVRRCAHVLVFTTVMIVQTSCNLVVFRSAAKLGGFVPVRRLWYKGICQGWRIVVQVRHH